MINLSVEQQEAFTSAYFSAAYFADFRFTNGAARFTSWDSSLDWGGYTWAGAGAMGGIAEVKDSEKLETASIDFTLTVADPAIVSLAVSSVEIYRNKPVYLYMAPMRDGAILGTPVLTWQGFMDQMTLGLGASGGSISLRCVPLASKMLQAKNIRVNDAVQKASFPSSRGFEYQTRLVADPHLWLSKDFQAQRY